MHFSSSAGCDRPGGGKESWDHPQHRACLRCASKFSPTCIRPSRRNVRTAAGRFGRRAELICQSSARTRSPCRVGRRCIWLGRTWGSKVLSSGFLLPGINVDGADETGDIHIAAHGLDVRVRGTEGVVRVHTTLSVYGKTPNATSQPVAGPIILQSARCRLRYRPVSNWGLFMQAAFPVPPPARRPSS